MDMPLLALAAVVFGYAAVAHPTAGRLVLVPLGLALVAGALLYERWRDRRRRI